MDPSRLPIRVLLVDDESDQLDIAELGLSNNGDEFTVLLESSPLAAVKLVHSSPIDCIVSDYLMPEMDGLELCKKLRAEGYETPFIVFTGQGSEEVAERAFDVGADNYIRKEKNLSVYAVLAKSIKSLVLRHRAEESLRDSEERYRSLFSNMSSAFAYNKIIYDSNMKPVDFIFLDINNEFEEVTGLTREQVLGRRGTEVLPGIENELSSWISVYGGVLPVGERIHFENYIKQLGKWLSVTAYCPEKEYFVIIFRDISDRVIGEKQLKSLNEKLVKANEELNLRNEEYAAVNEELLFSNRELESLEVELRKANQELLEYSAVLKQSEERYRQLVEHTPTGIYEVDFDTMRFKSVNKEMCRILGYTEEELLSLNPLEILGAESGKLFLDRVRRAQSGETPYDYVEYKAKKKDGTEIWGLLNTRFKYEKNKIVGAYVVAHDITERKKTENRANLQNKILSGINRILGAALKADSLEMLGEICLSVAEEVTESQIGFIGDIGEDNILHELAISNPGWEACKTISDKGHRRSLSDFRIHGIYGRVLIDGKSLITNDLSNHPDRVGLPKGHPPLTSFLGSPLIYEDKVVGMIAVGNRTEGYTKDEQQMLESLAPVVVEAIKRRRADKSLHQSEEQALLRAQELETVLDVIPIAVWISHDPECKVITGNQVANKFYEAKSGENVSAGPASGGEWNATRRFFRNGVELMPEDLPMQEASLKGVEVRDSELEVTQPSGGRITILGNAKPLKNGEGQVRGCVATFMDITDRKKSEEKLRAATEKINEYTTHLERMVREKTQQLMISEERLRSFVDSATEGFTLYDQNLDLIETNYAILKRFPPGTRKDDLIGKNIKDIYPDIENSPWYEAYKNVLETGKPYNVERQRGVSVHSGLIFDASAFKVGEGIGVISRDITKSQELEQRLRDSERGEFIDRISAMVAHDIRSPLNIAAQALATAKMTPEKAEHFYAMAERNVLRSIEMIEGLRENTRFLEPKIMNVDFKKLVKSTIKESSHTKSIALDYKIGDGLDDVRLDPILMRRVLENLLANADDAITEGGTVEMKTWREDENIILTVRDDGVGIPEEAVEKIFTPLFTTKIKGIGLGLSFCKRAVEAHGGSISFTSKKGEGTIFTVKLPFRQSIMN